MKDWDTMQLLWQQDQKTGRFSIDEQSMQQQLLKDSKAFNRSVRFRDHLEATIGFAVALFFAAVPFIWAAKIDSSWQAHWEWIALSAGCLFVACAFVRQRMYAKQWSTDATADIRQTLENNLANVTHQIVLLKNIFWWYCLPIELPMLLVALKSDAFTGIRIPFILASVVFMAFVVGINWWTVKKELQPKQAGLQQLLSELEK
ncbi:MAG: hypothetical protein ACFHXK_16480 [bacterium]